MALGAPASSAIRDEGRGVLWEAGAAEAGAGVQEVPPDAAVEADPLGHVLHVRAEALAEVGDLVDECDLGREEAVGGVLDELRRLQRGEEHRRFDQEERPVERPHDRLRTFGLDPDDDPVGAHEVADGRAFTQELRVRDHIERGVRPTLPDDARDLPPGADGHGRFCRDDGVAREGVRNLAGRLEHEREVGVAVAPPARRADRQHHHVSRRYGIRNIFGEGKPPGGDISGKQRLQPWLVDRHAPRMQRRNPFRLGIDAGDGEAEFRETGG